MNKLNKAIIKSFTVAMVITLLFPAGIVGTIFGCTLDKWWLLTMGILSIIIGFYGMPFAWLNFAGKKSLKPVLHMIINEELLTVDEISEQILEKPKDIENRINKLIVGGYLTGYKYKDGVLELNQKKQTRKSNSVAKRTCPTCGAFMVLDGENFVCQYCKNVLEK